MRSALVLAVLVAAGGPSASAQCGTPGTNGIPQISIAGNTLGDTAVMTLSQARPFAQWLWLTDLTPGPTVLPFGTFCLGGTPVASIGSFGGAAPPTDVAGRVMMPVFLPPAASPLTALPFFMQAVVVDPAAPFSVAISNGLEYSLRTPHLYILSQGVASPFGSMPGGLSSFDALSDTFGFNVSQPPAADVARVPSLGWVVVLRQDGTVQAFDDGSGAPVLSVPAAVGLLNALRMIATADGTKLLVLYGGVAPNPFGGGSPGAVRIIDLPSGNAAPPVAIAGNPSDMIVPNAATIAYLRVGADLIAFDYDFGFTLPALTLGTGLGPITDWQVRGNVLVTLLGGVAANPFGGTGSPHALNGVDLTSISLVYPQAVPLPSVPGGTTAILRRGPGSQGPDVLFVTSPAIGTIVEVDPVLFTLAAATSVPVGTGLMELSAGGTEWLLVQSGATAGLVTPSFPGSLLVMDPTTLAVTSVAALPAEPQQAIVVLRSETLRRAYVVSGNTALHGIATDPIALPAAVLPIPVSSGALRVAQ